MFKVEPPSLNGSIWDEAGKSEIIQILISHQENCIKSLQFVYAENGEVHYSEIHGEPKGLQFNVVTLDYPQEFLTSLSGVYDSGYDLTAIAFGTNKRMYGPFGMTTLGNAPEFKSIEDSSYYRKFNYEFGLRSSFGGFHGSVRYSNVISIGIYIKPIQTLAELNPVVYPLNELGTNDSVSEFNIE